MFKISLIFLVLEMCKSWHLKRGRIFKIRKKTLHATSIKLIKFQILV